MAYADKTTADPNLIKRWLQRRRFSDAVRVLKSAQHYDTPHVLDFGGGNGEPIRQLAVCKHIQAVVYEPTPSLLVEASKNLAHLESVEFVDNLDLIYSRLFDYAFCLEVFEHLPDEQTERAIHDIHQLLKPRGFAVIGVPHEIFVPALLKGMFRACRRRGEFDTKFGNIFSALLGRPPVQRPVSEISEGFPYHFHHMGFDFRILERKLKKRFSVIKRWFSPFPVLGRALNSEVYFLLRKT